MTEKQPGASGHRQRLRNRFAKNKLDGMHDYEAIELLLTYAIPRKDVKPLAKALIDHFGGLSGVMNASAAELMSFPGIGQAATILFLLVRELNTRTLEEKVRTLSCINSPADVCNFLRMKIGCGKKETLMVMYLDSRRHLIEFDLYPGTVDHSSVYAREITERALLCHACGIILAHNHPSKCSDPSKEDIALTRSLNDTLSRLGIILVDHLIVTTGDCKSFWNGETQTLRQTDDSPENTKAANGEHSAADKGYTAIKNKTE